MTETRIEKWTCPVHGLWAMSREQINQMVIYPRCGKPDPEGRLGVCGRQLSGPIHIGAARRSPVDDAKAQPIFDRDGPRLLRVRCSACDWSASGNAGTTGHGIAWAAHANEAHPG